MEEADFRGSTGDHGLCGSVLISPDFFRGGSMMGGIEWDLLVVGTNGGLVIWQLF